MPKIPIEDMDLLVISASAFNTLLGWAVGMPKEDLAMVMAQTSIAIPQLTFTEEDFIRQIEEDDDAWWNALSEADRAAQLRYWLDQEYDLACEFANEQITSEIALHKGIVK